MKTLHHKKLITKFVDDSDKVIHLPDELREQATAQKEISSLLKNAYSHEFNNSKLDYLEQRLIAEISQMEKPGICERIANRLGFMFCKRKSLVWGLTATAAIAIIALSTMFNKSVVAETPDYESFVIYETDSGDSFVQYFKYNVVEENEK